MSDSQPPDLGFGHLIDSVDFLEVVAPVTEEGLRRGELGGQALVAIQSPEKVCLGTRFDHL